MAYFFTSESVSEGHPDKISDLISDSIANAIINGNINHRAAVETLVTTNSVVVAGEYKRDMPIDDETVESYIVSKTINSNRSSGPDLMSPI